MEKGNCPVCNVEFQKMMRYPNSICIDCIKNIVDEEGNLVTFSITHEYGDITRTYTKDNHTITTLSNVGYVAGVKCNAGEMRFGGIVIQAKN